MPTPTRPKPNFLQSLNLSPILMGCVQRTFLVSAQVVLINTILPSPIAAQEYTHTTFLNGFASDSLIWERAYYDPQTTVPNYLRQQGLDLRTVDNPNVNDSLTYSQSLERIAPRLGSGYRVFVGHSMGALIARGLYIRHPELRPNFAAIVAVAGPHEGVPLAVNANEAVRFFEDVQRRVNAAITVVQIQAAIIATIGFFTPGLTSTIWAVTTLVLNSTQQAQISLDNVDQLPRLPALADLAPDSTTIQSLTRYDDQNLPRANFFGTIPIKDAVFRLKASADDKDYKFHGYVDDKNNAIAVFKACKYIGYATIIFSGAGRKCAYAVKVLKRIDGRWARYVNGVDSRGNPLYIPFDGAVPNQRQVYPSNTTLAYANRIDGLNHWNIYKTRAGLSELATALRRVGVRDAGPPPPPPGFSLTIQGASSAQVGCQGTWAAYPTNGVAPFHYDWLVNGSPYDTGGGDTLYYTASQTGSLSLQVNATDANGATSHAYMTVTVDSGNCM